VGVVGFCMCGGVANYLATQLPDLAAPFLSYGAQPPAGRRRQDQAALFDPLRRNDDRINAGWPAL